MIKYFQSSGLREYSIDVQSDRLFVLIGTAIGLFKYNSAASTADLGGDEYPPPSWKFEVKYA